MQPDIDTFEESLSVSHVFAPSKHLEVASPYNPPYSLIVSFRENSVEAIDMGSMMVIEGECIILSSVSMY